MQSEVGLITNLPHLSLSLNQQPQDSLRAQQWLFQPHHGQLLEAQNPTLYVWTPNVHNQTQQLQRCKKVVEITQKNLCLGVVDRTEAGIWSTVLNSANRTPLQPNAQKTLSHELKNTKSATQCYDEFNSKESSKISHLNSGGLRSKQKTCCLTTV